MSFTKESSNNSIVLRIIHVFLKVTSIIFLVFTLIIAAYFLLAKLFDVIDRANFEGYLKDKYSKEFKIESMRVNGAMIGDPGQLIGVAYPVDNKNLTFEVFKNRKKGVYSDEYSGAVWAEEERPVVTSFLKTIYGEENVPNFVLRTRIRYTANDPIRGSIPSVNYAIAQYKDNFFYSIEIQLEVDKELSQDELNYHNQKMKQIADFVISKNVSRPSVGYAINVKNQNASYSCILSGDKLTNNRNYDNCIKHSNRKAW